MKMVNMDDDIGEVVDAVDAVVCWSLSSRARQLRTIVFDEDAETFILLSVLAVDVMIK
jgi:hypothetical protein